MVGMRLTNDAQLMKEGSHRLQVEMIKYNQIDENTGYPDKNLDALDSALESCRRELSKSVAKIILDLSA